MKTKLLFSFLLSAAALSGAPIERGFWHLTPDAEAKLAELRANQRQLQAQNGTYGILQPGPTQIRTGKGLHPALV